MLFKNFLAGRKLLRSQINRAPFVNHRVGNASPPHLRFRFANHLGQRFLGDAQIRLIHRNNPAIQIFNGRHVFRSFDNRR